MKKVSFLILRASNSFSSLSRNVIRPLNIRFGFLGSRLALRNSRLWLSYMYIPSLGDESLLRKRSAFVNETWKKAQQQVWRESKIYSIPPSVKEDCFFKQRALFPLSLALCVLVFGICALHCAVCENESRVSPIPPDVLVFVFILWGENETLWGQKQK